MHYSQDFAQYKTFQEDIVMQYKNSLGVFIADIVPQILSWMAEEERIKIRRRQREGIDLSLRNGRKFGRPTIHVSEEFKIIYRKWKGRELTAVEAMQKAGVKKTSFYKLVKALEKETAKPL